MPIIRALPSTDSGKALLELYNDSADSVTVSNALVCSSPAGGTMAPLIDWPIQLPPGKSKTVDVTQALLRIFNDPNQEPPRKKQFQILLDLDPAPSGQPAPGLYTASCKNGQFTRFSSP